LKDRREMQAVGKMPDIVSYNTLTFAFQKHGLMGEAARILHEMIAVAFNLTSSHTTLPSAAMQVLGSLQKLGTDSNLLRRVATGQVRSLIEF
jgi:pentatricopeptide repeat protein